MIHSSFIPPFLPKQMDTTEGRINFEGLRQARDRFKRKFSAEYFNECVALTQSTFLQMMHENELCALCVLSLFNEATEKMEKLGQIDKVHAGERFQFGLICAVHIIEMQVIARAADKTGESFKLC